MGKHDKYLSFPVQLLREEDIKQVVSKAIDYGIIDYMVRHELKGVSGFNEACNVIGVNYNGTDKKEVYKLINGVYESLNGSIDKVVYVSIKKDMLFEFIDNKTDFEIDVFRAFIGVKSIIAKKKVQKLTNDFLLARMFGFSSVANAYEFQCDRFGYYVGVRYRVDKIKNELERAYKMRLYGRTRGFYVSFSMTLEALVKYVEVNKKTYKDKQFIYNKNAIISSVKSEIAKLSIL